MTLTELGWSHFFEQQIQDSESGQVCYKKATTLLKRCVPVTDFHMPVSPNPNSVSVVRIVC